MYKIYFKRLYFLILHAKFTLKNDIPLQLETEVQRFISKFILCYFAPPHFAVVIICLVFIIGLRNVLWCWLA